MQLLLIEPPAIEPVPRLFAPWLSVAVNRKGVLDVDTVKGCTYGMAARPEGGCYGLCYANKLASLYGYDFSQAVSRRPAMQDRDAILGAVLQHPAPWFRIGTMGDPCHDWPLTAEVCKWLGNYKIPVIITKHWRPIPDDLLPDFRGVDTVFNTSVSAFDTEAQRNYRLAQHERLKTAGIVSALRIVSAQFGDTPWGKERRIIQERLFALTGAHIDNPLRIPATDPRVVNGDILVERHPDLGGGSTVSIANPTVYLGHCNACPDQCGVNMTKAKTKAHKAVPMQTLLFQQKVEFEHVQQVIGSGYENDVAKLAVRDGI